MSWERLDVGEISLRYEIRGEAPAGEADLIAFALRRCAEMAQSHPPALARQDFPQGRILFGTIWAQFVLTRDPAYCGVGSGDLGSIKVFWRPYSDPPEGTRCDPQRVPLFMDSIHTTAHEFHHALGGRHLPYLLVPFYVLRATWTIHHEAFGGFLNPAHYEEWKYELERWILRKRARGAVRTLLHSVRPIPRDLVDLVV